MTSAPNLASVQAPAPPLDSELAGEIERARSRSLRGLEPRELLAASVVAGAFLATTAWVAISLSAGRAPSLVVVALLVAVYALATRVEFEIGSGLAIPTQLVFVPMLFLLPLELVPLCVSAGLVLGHGVDHIRAGAPARILLELASSWHAIGPVLVLAAFASPEPAWADWPVYVTALAAQFAFDYASCAAHEWLARGASPRSQLRFMAHAYVGDAAVAPIGLVVASLAVARPATIAAVLPLLGLLAILARERRTGIDQALELGHAYRGTAFLLGDVVEADNAYTGSHSRDVVSLVLAVADELELDPHDRNDAEFVALLHDVGKIRVPAEIINKPGPLSPSERAIVESHTVEGERMLSQVGGLLGHVGRLVRSCHERVDGSGYPDGLAGDDIPLVSRIVCCCDAFSAMTTDRSYRPAMTHPQALAEMRRNAGAQFDASVVAALISVLGRGAVERVGTPYRIAVAG